MNKYIRINALAILCVVVSSMSSAEEAKTPEQQNPAAGTDTESVMKNERGYFFGYSFGNMLKEGGNVDVDLEALRRGLDDSISGRVPDLTPEQQKGVISIVRARQQEQVKQREDAKNKALTENKAAADKFLAENAKKEGVKTTESGLQYKRLSKGAGPHPTAESTVVVHYEGKLINGEVFDSSIKRGTPAEFRLNQVIPGWTEGLQLMKAGEKAQLFIPSELAYGPGGTRGIPPNSALIFDIQLMEIK